MAKVKPHLNEILKTLPTKAGCYIYRNKEKKVIYVGKAINLRNRVRSYFHATHSLDFKTYQLVKQIEDIEWIVVGSELEALILELNLIKKHRPFYNIRLKDDKNFPYIKIHMNDPFPKVSVTRQMVQDGSKYYGPYTSVWAVHQTLDVLRRIFPYQTCDRVFTGKDSRACLYYEMKLCAGPCIGAIDQAGYAQLIADLCSFLEGNTGPVIERLTAEMEQASEELRFETAAAKRNQIQAIEKVVERQKVVTTDQTNSDVIALARDENEACVQVFFIRNGKLIGREYFVLEGTAGEADSEVLSEFIKQFYSESASLPQQLLLQNDIEEAAIIKQWLRSRKPDQKIEIKIPKDGISHELVEMATENAVETLSSLKTRWESDTNRQSAALADLQQVFNLSEAPNRIECYDISNTQGSASVGSMVVFEQGVPAKGMYRRFNIKNVSGPDDFASMEEVLTRRLNRWKSIQEDESPGKKVDPSFALLPDILLVDGGKGQLGRAVAVLERFGLSDIIRLAGLAKQQEELFFPHTAKPMLLPRNSQGLFLLQRIRDEAHRFAITAHRNRRSKLGLVSQLESVPGIGPVRRKALLKHFGSIEGIKEASVEEICRVGGINETLAVSLQSSLE